MQDVKAKKHLGQHFLKNEAIAEKIVAALPPTNNYDTIMEIGPGMGVLTRYLLNIPEKKVIAIEIDTESINYLINKFPQLKIIEGDFLKLNLDKTTPVKIAVIGNFPYNISSQILFKVLENKEKAPFVVGMFQKEVAQRIASGPGNKEYGILSVLMQTFYDVEYLFSVDENEFIPPPKVKSGVLLFKIKENKKLNCSEKLLFNVVKTAFNQRRKTLSNALKSLNVNLSGTESEKYLDKRAEQLSYEEFEILTGNIESIRNNQ
jgi:16S rRNA (adenine1518-N6/adenine1519-N6)-dimethyltransferase